MGSIKMPSSLTKPLLFNSSTETKNGKRAGKTVSNHNLIPRVAAVTEVFGFIINEIIISKVKNIIAFFNLNSLLIIHHLFSMLIYNTRNTLEIMTIEDVKLVLNSLYMFIYKLRWR